MHLWLEELNFSYFCLFFRTIPTGSPPAHCSRSFGASVSTPGAGASSPLTAAPPFRTSSPLTAWRCTGTGCCCTAAPEPPSASPPQTPSTPWTCCSGGEDSSRKFFFNLRLLFPLVPRWEKLDVTVRSSSSSDRANEEEADPAWVQGNHLIQVKYSYYDGKS